MTHRKQHFHLPNITDICMECTGHWKKWCPKANQISQTKMKSEGNSMCFSDLNDSGAIPSTVTEILVSKNYGNKSEQKLISVKGKLKGKYKFWQNIMKTNETIFQIIEKGYMLSFIETLSKAKFLNDKYALTNWAFVQEAIEDVFIRNHNTSKNFCFRKSEKQEHN